MTWQSWIPFLGLVPTIIVLGLLTLQRRLLDSDHRREAITTQLHHLPAASLQTQLDELVTVQMTRLVSSMIIGLFAAMFIVSRRTQTNLLTLDGLDYVALLVLVGSGLYYGIRMICEMPRGRRLKLAARAEQATAQELSASLAGDNRIIHDVQTGSFNIDHVVITPAGIFAIETKSRMKPPAGSGSPKVKYDGKQLDFGSWKETKPIEQAERQARWLADYLRKETGESVPVAAVLALPGWFVDRIASIKSGMVQVINPKNSSWLFLPDRQTRILDSAAIQQAANAIEKLAL
jgi:hypothetical protein